MAKAPMKGEADSTPVQLLLTYLGALTMCGAGLHGRLRLRHMDFQLPLTPHHPVKKGFLSAGPSFTKLKLNLGLQRGESVHHQCFQRTVTEP